MNVTPFRFTSLMIVLALLTVTPAHGDWPRWRGPDDIGSTEAGTYPVKLDEEHTLWRIPLPGKGCSTPIVLGETIYVTAPIQGNDGLIAFDRSGKQRWQTSFGPEDPGKHRNGSGSNSSPATDGDAIFVYYKSGTLAAVEWDGSVRWKTNLVDEFGKANLFWDHGTSPVLTDRYVIMARMHAGPSWLAAFDKQTGEMAWNVDRTYETPIEGDHGYSTPLVIERDGKESLLVWGGMHLTIHSVDDGAVEWSCGNFNPENNGLWPSIAMPVIVDDIAVICYGRNDRGAPRTFGIRLSGSGDVTDANHVWLRDDIGSFVPSPLAYQGRVYLVRDKGEVECIDPATGENVWSDRFPKGRPAFYASPLIAGGHLYGAREDGAVFVADIADDGFELLSENDLGESVIGSPVPDSGRLLIRGTNHLFCFGNQEKTQ